MAHCSALIVNLVQSWYIMNKETVLWFSGLVPAALFSFLDSKTAEICLWKTTEQLFSIKNSVFLKKIGLGLIPIKHLIRILDF